MKRALPLLTMIRYCQRLTPITKTDAATAVGLKRLAPIVLKPEFHADDQKPVKFAIKSTCRNHSVLSRDEIIKAVAESVGRDHGHKVDLKNYDKLILVEAYKGSIGMSVVDPVYDDLEKFNLGRLQDLATKSVKGAQSYVKKEISESTEQETKPDKQLGNKEKIPEKSVKE